MHPQYLENELASPTQGNMSITDYFLKVKTMCVEILDLGSEEPVVFVFVQKPKTKNYEGNKPVVQTNN